MSNASYITTKRHLKSYDIEALLRKINEKRFDGKMNISRNKFDELIVQYKDYDDIEIEVIGKRKLSFRDPNMPWMSYVAVVFRNELGKMTNAIMSTECLKETWKPNPRKYPSYRAWLEKHWTRIMRSRCPAWQACINDQMRYVPEGMEKY